MRALRPQRPLFRGTMQPSDDLDAFLREQTADGVFWAEKLDGERCVAGVATDGRVTFFSRSGLHRERGKLAYLEDDARRLALALECGELRRPVLLDGELLGGDLHVFDVASLADVYLLLRLRRLRAAHDTAVPFDSRLRIVPHHFLSAERAGELPAIAKEVMATGGEGIVAKAALSGYRPCVSPAWLRIKRHQTWDLQVLGMEVDAGRVRALVCRAPGGAAVRVSAGLSDAQRRAFAWSRPRMIEVRAQEETRRGSLREPVFVRVREDK